MKMFKLCFALILAHLFLAASFGATYIKFDGVKGNSKDENHKGWIDVVYVSGIGAPKDAASGMVSGKREHEPITLKKRVDKSSPLFQGSGTSGESPLFQSRMTIKHDGMTYVLEGIKVLSAKEDGETETLTISYASITLVHKTATMKSLKPTTTKATDYNSSRSNQNSNH